MKINRPVSDNFPISSPYGERIDPITHVKKMHNGIDFAVPVGTPVHASVDGIIKRVGWENTENHAQGFGQRIWQFFKNETDEQYGIVYAHLSQIDVRDGMTIKSGEIIGLSGNSGKSSGPHLHIGVRTWNQGIWKEIEV